MQASFRLNICKHTFGLILSPCEIRPFPPLIFLGLSVFVRRSLGRIFAVAQMRTTAKHGFAAYSLEDSLQKENSRFQTCYYTFLNFFYEIRPFPPLILLGLSVYARRSLGRIFAVAQMRTTAKHGFAAYSLEDSLQKENSRSLTCHISRAAPLFFRDTAVSAFNSFGFIRVCTAEPRPDFSLSLKCDRRQSMALPRTPSRTRSKQKKNRQNLFFFVWSGKRDSNSRHLPWQGNALPLSHSRILVGTIGLEPMTPCL